MAKGILRGRPKSDFGENLAGCFRARTDTVGDADPREAVAGEREAGEFLAKRLNADQAFEMADGILGHRRLPFVNACEKRLGGEPNDLAKFVADDLQNLIFGGVEDLFVARASQKAADDGAVFWGAMREFVVDEFGGKHAASGAARDEE